MNVIRIEREGIELRMTQRELTIVSNTINETLEAIEEWEFETRVGGNRQEAIALLKNCASILDQLG